MDDSMDISPLPPPTSSRVYSVRDGKENTVNHSISFNSTMQHKAPLQSTHPAKPAKQPQSTIVIDLSEDDDMTDASPLRPATMLLAPQRPQHAKTTVHAEPKKALDPVDDLTKRFAALKSPTQTASRFPKEALNPNPTIRRALNGRAPSPLRSSAITMDKAPERPAPLVFSDADMPKSTQQFRPIQPRPVADPLKTSSTQPQHLTLPPLDRPHQKPQFKDLPQQSQPQQKAVTQQLQQQPQQRKPQSIQSLYHQQFVQQKQQVNNDKKLVVPTYNSSRLMVIDNNPLPIFAASTAKRDIPKVTTTATQQPHNIFSLSSTSSSNSSITLAASSSRTTTVVNATSNNTPSSAFDVATLSERLYQQIQKQEVVKAVPTTATKEKPKKKKGKEKNKGEKKDDEDVSEDEEEDSEEEDEAAEQFKQPKDLLVKLLPYQMTALKWMLHNESAESETKGGILADDMGLGKTVQILSLVLAHRKDDEGRAGGPSLVVCTVSTLQQWLDEVRNRIRPHAVSIATYYGRSRSSDTKALERADIVLTTYGTLVTEFKNEKSIGPLGRMNWWRVILDEAHAIKNKKTKTAKAASRLNARYRWCLTGTPIQNSLDDLYSLLHFIRVPNFSDETWWKDFIIRPVNSKYPQSREKGMIRLHTIMAGILLRRTKDQKIDGKPILELPEKKIVCQADEFTAEEKALYDAVFSRAKLKFNQLMKEGTVENSYMKVLEMLLRLRQICDHSSLVANAIDLGEKQVVCCLCLDSAREPVSTSCKHFFCKECLESWQEETDSHACAFCQKELKKSEVTPMENPEQELPGGSKKKKTLKASTKITALLSALKDVRDNHPGEKAIIFSQFTSFLDTLQFFLQKEGFSFTRLDGSMSQKNRSDAVSLFKTSKDVNLILISLKAGGTGLNLVEANRAFLLDPWWNPTTEQQAIDRIYRLGQKKNVLITRFMIKDTIEEKIVALQEKKMALANGVLGNDKRAVVSKLNLADLKLLFSE